MRYSDKPPHKICELAEIARDVLRGIDRARWLLRHVDPSRNEGTSTCVKSQFGFDGAKSAEHFQLIRNLEIENFRCFEKLVITDARQFTIVTGPNAAGKSALLEAIFLAGGNSPELWLLAGAWRGRELQLPTQPSGLTSILQDYFYQFDVTKSLRVCFRDSRGNDRELQIGTEKNAVLKLPFEASKSIEAVSSQPPTLKFHWKTPKGDVSGVPVISQEGMRMDRPQDA